MSSEKYIPPYKVSGKAMNLRSFPKKSGHSRKTSPSGFDSGSGGL